MIFKTLITNINSYLNNGLTFSYSSFKCLQRFITTITPLAKEKPSREMRRFVY